MRYVYYQIAIWIADIIGLLLLVFRYLWRFWCEEVVFRFIDTFHLHSRARQLSWFIRLIKAYIVRTFCK